MKKKNDTWLGFFKKTLKISGFILIIIILALIFLFYKMVNHDDKTYLICKDEDTKETSYRAFNKYRMFSDWDPLNEKFERSFDIIEINKKLIKARAYAYADGNIESLSLSNNVPKAEFVYELIWELDRETGRLKAYFSERSDAVDEDRVCNKISKNKLPITKVKQKF